VIFTYRSPFGDIPEFVEDEIPFWNDAKKVLIISLADKNERYTAIGAHAEAYAVSPVRNPLKRIKAVLSGLLFAGVMAEFLKIIKNPKSILQKYFHFAVYVHAMERYFQGARRVLEKHQINEFDSVILYSYWLGPSTHAAIHLKKKLKANDAIVISRAHGSDLYEYAHSFSYLPFRKQLVTACNGLYPISRHGMRYLIEHWKCPPEKIEMARLGIHDHFSGRYPKRNEYFHIISCAYVTSIKRIHLIAEALSKIDDKKIHWTHVGGGPELGKLTEICSILLKDKRNVQYALRDNLLHPEVIKIFRTDNINLLVNTSASEGIPVTMMEAQCSAIPVLAPCVGGINEIIEQDVNGRLMRSDFSAEDLRKEILSIMEMDNKQYEEMCLMSRKNWCDHYSARNNYSKFVQSAMNLTHPNIAQKVKRLRNMAK